MSPVSSVHLNRNLMNKKVQKSVRLKCKQDREKESIPKSLIFVLFTIKAYFSYSDKNELKMLSWFLRQRAKLFIFLSSDMMIKTKLGICWKCHGFRCFKITVKYSYNYFIPYHKNIYSILRILMFLCLDKEIYNFWEQVSFRNR